MDILLVNVRNELIRTVDPLELNSNFTSKIDVIVPFIIYTVHMRKENKYFITTGNTRSKLLEIQEVISKYFVSVEYKSILDIKIKLRIYRGIIYTHFLLTKIEEKYNIYPTDYNLFDIDNIPIILDDRHIYYNYNRLVCLNSILGININYCLDLKIMNLTELICYTEEYTLTTYNFTFDETMKFVVNNILLYKFVNGQWESECLVSYST